MKQFIMKQFNIVTYGYSSVSMAQETLDVELINLQRVTQYAILDLESNSRSFWDYTTHVIVHIIKRWRSKYHSHIGDKNTTELKYH